MSVRSRHSVLTVSTQRSATALALGARTGVRITRTPSVREDLVERARELGVPVPEEEPDALQASLDGEVPGLLGDPRRVGMGGDAGQVDPAGAELDEEQDVHGPEPGGLHGEEVAGPDPLGLGPEEFGPGRPVAPGCRTDPGSAKDGADGGGAEAATQQARNYAIADALDNVRYLVRDRDAKFTRSFDDVWRTEDVSVIRTPVRAPRANAVAERWVRTVRAECTDRMLILTRRHLNRVLRRYVDHYNDERPHRGLQLETPVMKRRPTAAASSERIRRRDVLGGLIHEYWAGAA